MGYRAISWAWIVPGPSPTERFILLALADSASNSNGTCWPGLELIASMTGYSKRTVIANINSLANRQLISIVERRDEQGRQRTNLYRLSLQGETPAPRDEADDTTPLESDALRVKLAHEPGESDDASRVNLTLTGTYEPSEEEPSEGTVRGEKTPTRSHEGGPEWLSELHEIPAWLCRYDASILAWSSKHAIDPDQALLTAKSAVGKWDPKKWKRPDKMFQVWVAGDHKRNAKSQNGISSIEAGRVAAFADSSRYET